MKRVAIFASGKGSNFEHIIKSQIPCINIEILVTDNLCDALNIASHYHIESRTFFRKNYATKQSMEEEIATLLKEKKIDLIILAGYMRLFSPWFVNQFQNKIINIHPSLLPHYKGRHAIEQALRDGKKIYGVSVHYVNEGMDEGKIIEQVKVLYDGFLQSELEQKIHECEYELYPKVIAQLCKEGELS